MENWETSDRKCPICKDCKGFTTKFNDEGYITELFVCECGHEEIL